MSDFLEIFHEHSQGLPLPYLKWLKTKLVKFGPVVDHPNESLNRMLYPRMRPNHCMANAMLAAQSGKRLCRYVEGFHYDTSRGEILFHCWNTFDGESVVDFTRHFWVGKPAPSEEEFWGVELPLSIVSKYAVERFSDRQQTILAGVWDTPLVYRYLIEPELEQENS